WLQLLPFIKSPVFNIYSFWGIIWVHLTTNLGVKVLLLAPAFRNLDAALEESSRSCGVTALGTLRRVVVPLMAPAILVSTILGLIRSLDAFEVELLLGVPIRLYVYSTKIRDLVTFEPPQYAPALALGTMLLVVLLLLVAIQRLYIGRRVYKTIGGRGFSTRQTFLGAWRWPAAITVTGIAVAVTVVPMLVLLMGTFMRAFGYFNIPNPWTIEHWQRVLSDPLLLRALRNTLVVGAGTAVIGTVFYSLIAYVIVKTRFPGRAALDLLSWLPWAVPGILMGLALLWTVFATPVLLPLYGTVGVLVLALLGPTLITVALIGFMSAARDISTIVLLGSSESRTLSLLSLDFAYGGQFEKATVVAVLTAGLVIAAAGLTRKFGGKLGIAGSNN